MVECQKKVCQKEQTILLKTYIEIINLLIPLHIHDICTNA